MNVNGALWATVASGATLAGQVHDTADADVGTVISTTEVEIADSSNEVNGVDISDPTVAEGTHNQQIQNQAGTPVGTAANPSVIANSQAQVNGVNTETIAATVTHNQEIQDSAGTDVGTAANPSVISDNTINFNGADVDTVKAEETYAFLVKLDGSNSGTYNAGTNTVSVTSAACADATTQVNAVNVGTVASGGTFDQQIHDSAGADVGTAANPSIVSDATITINSASLGATGDVVAEGTQDITVNLDGSPSGSWSGSSWDVTSSSGSVAVGLDDSTPDYNDSITITATPSGITPTSYTFFTPDKYGNLETTTQAGNTLAWNAANVGTDTIYVTATDGADTVASSISVTTTVNLSATNGKLCFSYYKLVSAYAGYWIRIRRNSDNSESDIAYTDGKGDLAAAQTFAGAKGYQVVTYYNQFSNGDMTQSTGSVQPSMTRFDLLMMGKANRRMTATMSTGYALNDTSTDYFVQQLCEYIAGGTRLLHANAGNRNISGSAGGILGLWDGTNFPVTTSAVDVQKRHVLAVQAKTNAPEIYLNGASQTLSGSTYAPKATTSFEYYNSGAGANPQDNSIFHTHVSYNADYDSAINDIMMLLCI